MTWTFFNIDSQIYVIFLIAFADIHQVLKFWNSLDGRFYNTETKNMLNASSAPTLKQHSATR